MRHWTRKVDYTVISYKGVVPRRAILTGAGVEIPTAPRSVTPDFTGGGGLVPIPELIQDLQKTTDASQRNHLPARTVEGIVTRNTSIDLKSRIENVPADVKTWPDPPHIEFANCPFDSPADVKRFVETYGVGLSMIDDLALPAVSPKAITIKLERFQKDQEFLQQSWGRTEHTDALKESFAWYPDDMDFIEGKPRIVLRDIWDYVLALFLIDLSAGRLRVCKNKSCKRLKYFVQERRDQKFCSVSCKNTFNVHSWLATQANREGWNAGRRERRRKRA